MSTVIHHGHPGSYKSSGCIQRDVLPQLLEGRTIVTNVRGFDSVEKVEKAFGKQCKEGAAIYYVDTEGKEGRLHMAKFFHWAPKGALILIDEAQDIFPTRRTDFKLQHLDYPGGAEAAERDDRPYDVCNAFDMHRHHNWDIYLCTPNIKKIHSEIREAAQVAFRHYSMGELLPWKKGKWREVEHDPENNGKAESHAYGVPKEYKIDERVFAAYQSTKTGEYRANAGPGNILKDKKLIAVGVVLIGCILGFIYFSVQIWERETARRAPDPVALEQVDSAGNDVVAHADRVGGDTLVHQINSDIDHPLSDAVISITGRFASTYMFSASDQKGEFALTQDELFSFGYDVLYRRSCYAELMFDGEVVQKVYCSRSYNQLAPVESNGGNLTAVSLAVPESL